MKNSLLILGAGQFGLMVKEIAESTRLFDKIDFLDDNSELAIGKLASVNRYAPQYKSAIVAIGSAPLRLSLISELISLGFDVPVLISPHAYVSPSATLMPGCIVEPLAAVQTGASLSVGCIISSGAVVRHNASLGEGCHADCNAVIASNVQVPGGTKINAGEIYR